MNGGSFLQREAANFNFNFAAGNFFFLLLFNNKYARIVEEAGRGGGGGEWVGYNKQ